MDGARYNRDEQTIDDQLPAELYSAMPVIHFNPKPDYVREIEDYECPIYKTGKRAGALSTTGLSTNFVLFVDVPSLKSDPDKWVRRAAAMLCMLND